MDSMPAVAVGLPEKLEGSLSEDTAADVHLRVSSDPSSNDYVDLNLIATAEMMDSRPILVGYAFGPKKMSTMGVVMAEASKTLLSTLARTVLVEEADEDEATAEDDDDHRYDLVCADHDQDDDEHDDHSSNSNIHQVQFLELTGPVHQRAAEELPATSSCCCEESTVKRTASATCNSTPRSSPRRKSVNSNGNIMLSLDSYNGGLKNIVRYLHSSCSSVDSSSTGATLLTTGTSAVTPSSASTCKLGGASTSGIGSTAGDSQQRLRVSFVPLDPDFPLEGQHGAKMDIILHKLTEDILCLSKFSPLFPALVPRLGKMDGELETSLKDMQPNLSRDAQAAILRVHRLMQYQKKHPDCLLADDPSKVLTLMSRSDIAHALADCLVGVTSASGIPVASPKFVVWDQDKTKATADAVQYPIDKDGSEEPTEVIRQRLRCAQMTYPLIAKPLQAAGTKISHYMTVLLNESSLKHIHDSSCLLQEYANHDAVLYKVYVLGNNVRVYQRPSLPNLPPLDTTEWTRSSYSPSYVDFDSQRPYPRLSAFGVVEGKDRKRRPPPPFLSSLTKFPSSSPALTVAVTAEEVQPIVDTLKKAFGLELFGFDILITTSSDDPKADENGDQDSSSKRQMLVVDVNYFPSYSEVPNFPALLAQYLTQRAVDRRRQPN